MLLFNIIISCHMVAGDIDHYFYLEKHDQGKRILDEINIICHHIKYEVVYYN